MKATLVVPGSPVDTTHCSVVALDHLPQNGRSPCSPSVCVPRSSSRSWHGLECPEPLSMGLPPTSILQTPAQGPRPRCGPPVTQPGLTHPSLQAPPFPQNLPRSHHFIRLLCHQQNPSSSFSTCIPSFLLGLPHLSFHKNNHLGLYHEATGKSVCSHVREKVKLPTCLATRPINGKTEVGRLFCCHGILSSLTTEFWLTK